MVCTSAFGAGNDYPHVRLVIHAGTPGEMIGFIQECGRAGRDKLPAKCYTLPLKMRHSANLQSQDLKGRQAMMDWLYPTPPGICLRLGLTSFCDGQGITCQQSPNSQLCVVCQNPSISKEQVHSVKPLFHNTSFGSVPSSAHSIISNSTPSHPSVKRKFGTAFQSAFELSKRRKIDQSQQEIEFVQRMKQALSRFHGICALCHIHGKEAEKHNLPDCPMWRILNLSLGTYFGWKRAIKYGRYHGPICWKCQIPPCSDTLHAPFSSRGTDACEYPDVLAPVAFGIFHDDELAKEAQLAIGERWGTSLVSFAAWLGKKPQEGHYSNMTTLFLWFTDYKAV